LPYSLLLDSDLGYLLNAFLLALALGVVLVPLRAPASEVGVAGRVLDIARRERPERGHSQQAELLARITRIEKALRALERHISSTETPKPISDEQYLALEKIVKSQHRRTMLSRGRLWTLWQAVHNVASLDGAAAEVGVYRGGSAYFLAASFAGL